MSATTNARMDAQAQLAVTVLTALITVYVTSTETAYVITDGADFVVRPSIATMVAASQPVPLVMVPMPVIVSSA